MTQLEGGMYVYTFSVCWTHTYMRDGTITQNRASIIPGNNCWGEPERALYDELSLCAVRLFGPWGKFWRIKRRKHWGIGNCNTCIHSIHFANAIYTLNFASHEHCGCTIMHIIVPAQYMDTMYGIILGR